MIQNREIGDEPNTPEAPPEEPVDPSVNAVRLTEITGLSDRYKDIMSAETVNINDYADTNSLDAIECICSSRHHGLHAQLNNITERLNQIDILLAAIARNTQTITITKTIEE